ncbi:uncharacterized protein LOC135846434 [Planococcus citri]|uniref:uncharacterized protein LOC135846434 n=1 Tax=Planococcus citri TaxID=170843 RepID=UPI0031F8D20D
MKRKLVHFVTILLHKSGLQLVKQKTPYHQHWILVGLLSYFTWAGTSTVILSLVSEDISIYRYINPIPYVSIGVIISGGVLIMVKHKEYISEMLHQIDQNVFVYPDEDLLDMEYEWYLDEGNLIIIMVVIFCIQMGDLFILCIPAVYEFYNYGRIHTLIYPGWSPWSLESIGYQLATMVVQFFGTASGLWLNQMLVMPVLLVLCEYLRQYKRLKKAISLVSYRSKIVGGDFDQNMKRNIVHCVVHMQKLRKTFYLFEVWFSKLFSCELAVCALSLAIGLFLTTSAASLSKTYNLIVVVVFVNVNLLARCLMGEIFFDLNDEIAGAIFTEIEWYNLNKEQQKLLIMFHHMACQPLTLFGFQIFAVTRVMFAKITRATYSVFNVMKASLN